MSTSSFCGGEQHQTVVTEVIDDVGQLRAENAALAAQLAAISASIGHGDADSNDAHTRELEKLREEYRGAVVEITALRSKVASLEGAVQDVKMHADHSEVSSQAGSESTARLVGQVARIKEQLSQVSKARGRDEDHSGSPTPASRYSSHTTEIQGDKPDTASELRLRLRSLKATLAERASHSESAAELDSVRKSLQASEQRVKDLEAGLAEAKQEADSREEALKSELAAAKQAAEHDRLEASEEADSNQARISALEQQLAAQSALWAQAEDDARHRIGDLEMQLVASTPVSPVAAANSVGSRDSPKFGAKLMSLQLEAAVSNERIRELEQEKSARVEELERALQAKDQELAQARAAAPAPPTEDLDAQQALSKLELELEAMRVRFAALETEKEGLLLQAQEQKDELRRSEIERASLQISVERLVEEKTAAAAEKAIAAVELERTLAQMREEHAARIEELEETLQAKEPGQQGSTSTAELEQELSSLRARLSAVESDKEEATKRADEQREELRCLETENTSLQMSVERLVEEKASAAAEKAIAAAELERALVQQREEHAARVEELEDDLQAKDQELEQLNMALSSRPQKDSAAQQSAARLEQELETLRSRCAALETEKEGLAAGLAAQANEHKELLQRVEEEKSDLQVNLQRLGEEKALAVAELERALSQQQEALNNNNDASSKLQEEQRLLLDHFQTELQSATSAVEHIRAQKLEVEAALALAREEASTKAAVMEDLVKNNAELGQASEQMLEENRQVVVELDRHKRDLASLRTELSVIKAQAATTKSQEVIEALEAEVAKARDLDEALRVQTLECSKLRDAHATLEAEHGRLAMRARMDSEKSQEVDALKAQITSLMREREETMSDKRQLSQDLDRNKEQLASLEHFRESAEAEIEEMKRLSEQHASERGTLDAEAARLRAENDVLAAESRDMLLRLTDLEARLASMHGFDRTSEAVASNGGALGEAERWVLNEASLPLERETMLYFGRVSIFVPDLASGPAAELASENATHRKRLKTTLESGDAARISLQVYRIHDPDRQGCLYWPGGQLLEYVEAAFVQHKLTPPKEAAVRWLFDRFAEDGIGTQKLDAKCCLGLVDALLRGAFFFEGSVEAEAPKADEPLKESDPFEAVQVKLRSRLDQAEQAADRALARAKTIASSAHQAFADVRLTPTSNSQQPLLQPDVMMEGLSTPVEILTLHSPVKQGTPVHRLDASELAPQPGPGPCLQGLSTGGVPRAALASQAPYSKAMPAATPASNGVVFAPAASASAAAPSVPMEPLQQVSHQLEQGSMPAHFTPRTKEAGPRVFPAPRQVGQFQESQSLMAPAVRIDLHGGGAVVDTLGVTTARPSSTSDWRQAASLHVPSRTTSSATALPANLRPAASGSHAAASCTASASALTPPSMGGPVSATASLPVPRPQQRLLQQQPQQPQYTGGQPVPASFQAYGYPNSYQALPPSMVAVLPSTASWYASG